MASSSADPQQPTYLVPSGASVLGHVVALDADGVLWVRLDGHHAAPVRARLAAPLGRQAVLDAVTCRQQAVFARPHGCAEPILLALLVPQAALASGAPDIGLAREAHRLVLRAGAATIVLHDSGKVELRGIRLLAQASEDHRILGRTVRIN